LNPLSEFWQSVSLKRLAPLLLLVVLVDAALVIFDWVPGFYRSWSFWMSILSLVGTVALVWLLIDVVLKAQEQARQVDARLRGAIEAIDAMPIGFAIYDKEDRMMLCNKMIAEIFPHLEGESLIGKTYEELIRQGVRLGKAPVPPEQEDAFVAKRLTERRSGDAAVLRAASDGRWFHHYEKVTPSGQLVAVRLNVTELVQKSTELEVVNAKLARLSTTDGLTGIANRRLFDESLQKEWLRSARSGQPLSLLLLDIDYFKRYNDRYGHLLGDECLRKVAKLLESCVKRSGELAARYGGEEFCILLPGTDADAARTVAEHCLATISGARIPHADSQVSEFLTLSIGVGTAVGTQQMPHESLVEQADSALYGAKAKGRARYEQAQSTSVGIG
jgi:diguanylate cyclase (GGDEF)-like protein